MNDLFDNKNVMPMLIAEMKEPFDSPDYIYEIKFDGIRCVAYLGENTDLRNKRNLMLLPKVPELENIHKQVSKKCILDGELVVLKNAEPDFYEIQRRALLTDIFKIRLAANKYPATFIAYDILYLNDKEIIDVPLIERKGLLDGIVRENERIVVSRYIENSGIQLFNLVKERKLEGIVAKKKDSSYWIGKRSKHWIKCKILESTDCVICGYIPKENNMLSIIIGQYKGDKLVYKGHVTLGVGLRLLEQYRYRIIDYSPFGFVPSGNNHAVWIEPNLVCIVEYMPSPKSGLRQPILKGIRDDKIPIECQE